MKDMDKSQIQKIIKQFLNSKLSESSHDDILNINSYLSGAVEVQQPAHSGSTDYRIRNFPTREGFILKSLGHLSANPSKPHNYKALIETYKFHSEDEDELKKDSPNANISSVEYFVDNIMKASIQEKNNTENFNENVRELFILHGERGVGKTIFINYLVTKYNSLFNDHKIIWIRLNLAEDFGGLKPDLVKWIKIKTLKIVLQYYYDKNPSFKDLVRDIRLLIKDKFKHDPDNFARYTDEFEYLISMFHEGKNPEKISASLVSQWLSNEVFNYVDNLSYSFIFILDNLDKLETSERFKQKASHLYGELSRLASRDTKLNGSFIFVVRTETLEYLRNKTDSTLDRWNTYESKILPIGFTSIFDTRIKFIEKYVNDNASKFDWDLSDWPDHIENFREYLTQISDSPDFKDFIAYLDRFYMRNQRVKTQFLQLCYHDSLGRISFPRSYRLVEAMCRSGFTFPPRIYKYNVNEKDEIVVDSQSKVFDNIFIPLITNFPYSPSYRKQIPFSSTYILCGLRIIQYIKAYSELLPDNEQFPMPFSRLHDILYKLFNYDKKIVYHMIEEFADQGILVLFSGQARLSNYMDNVRFSLSPKANYLYNFLPHTSAMEQKADSYGNIYPDFTKNFLHSIAYLNMCSMRCLINEPLLKGELPLFKAVLINFDIKSTFNDWVNWKILNSISLLRIMDAVNKIEMASMETNRLNKNELQIHNKVVPLNFESIKNSIIRQAGLIYDQMESLQKDQFLKLLERYIEKWNIIF